MTKRTISDAVHDLCSSLPDVECNRNHGFPDYRILGKVFAQYAVNHHGDGRVALWLNAAEGSQENFTVMDSEAYFVPPYLGPRGWLGMNLDKGLDWDEIQIQVAEAYLHTAKSNVPIEEIVPDVPPPNAPIDPIEFDAFNAPVNKKKLEQIRAICLALPETTEGRQFGTPAFKAGKKTFATAYVLGDLVCSEIWVGRDQQPALIQDSRFVVPRYTGHNGWIQFALSGSDHMERFRELVVPSYRHFALKRMLKALENES